MIKNPPDLDATLGALPSVGDITFKGDLLKHQSEQKLSCTETFNEHLSTQLNLILQDHTDDLSFL